MTNEVTEQVMGAVSQGQRALCLYAIRNIDRRPAQA